jgi:hypothetical protein
MIQSNYLPRPSSRKIRGRLGRCGAALIVQPGESADAKEVQAKARDLMVSAFGTGRANEMKARG